MLVIEDNAELRSLTVRMLIGLGYEVVDVADAVAARAVLRDGKPIDLILSDVVLPGGTSGPQFAEEVRSQRPDSKVIFMSGYAGRTSKLQGSSNPDTVQLNKPFRKRSLAIAVRAALDEKAAPNVRE